MELLLPDWAPNIHPLVIHFPIVLWITAVLFEVCSFFLVKRGLLKIALSNYVLATISALAAFLSGKQAVDLVSIPMQGELTAGTHSDWALYTLIFFMLYTTFRAFLFWKRWDNSKIVATILFLVGIAGVLLVTKTAELGGKLVYKYGVGVTK